METGQTVVKSILQEILIQASEQAIKGVDAQDAILYMNRWMAEQAAVGINLGYTSITSLADPITVPDGAINGIVFNVALNLVSSYDIIPNQRLAANAANGLKAMLNLGVTIGASSLPGTLPIGSGNEDDGGFNTRKFYPDEQDSILTEQNGDILLEDSTGDAQH